MQVRENGLCGEPERFPQGLETGRKTLWPGDIRLSDQEQRWAIQSSQGLRISRVHHNGHSMI
jgi:hypothetical protein